MELRRIRHFYECSLLIEFLRPAPAGYPRGGLDEPGLDTLPALAGMV